MEEQILTEETTPVVVEEKKERKAKEPFLTPAKLAIFAVVALLVASILSFLPLGISMLEGASIKAMGTNIGYILRNLMIGLLLPVSLFLLCSSSQKDKLSKVFVGVAALFIVVQLVSIVAVAIGALRGHSGFLAMMLNQTVCGSTLLSRLINAVKNLGDMAFVRGILLVLKSLLGAVGDLFYILVNAICAFGFIKLFPAKKK